MNIITFFFMLIYKRLRCLLCGKSFKSVNSPEMFWDVIAGTLSTKDSNSHDSTKVDVSFENPKKYFKSNHVVLDMGCATGSDALKIASLVKSVDGVDI